MIDPHEEAIIDRFAQTILEDRYGMLVQIGVTQPFTRSNGTVMARLYERLTKASRRRQNEGLASLYDQGYRQGLYDAYKALQDELS